MERPYALEVALTTIMRADENAEARAYIESLERDAARWQPIETAPRDGALLLLACSNWPHSEVLGKPVPIKVGGYWDGRWNVFGASWEPTHWMPLPRSPSRPVAAERGCVMGDRELLEAAARARGVPVHRWVQDADGVDVAVLDDGTYWQPLHENRATDCMGDALRLACALQMCVAVNRATSINEVAGTTALFYWAPDAWAWEPHEKDIYAATRRAIVRAAAALAAAEGKG